MDTKVKCKCSKCGEDKVKEFSTYHKSPSGGYSTKRRKKYVDETGLQWHGTTCPQCASEKRNLKNQAKAQAALEALKVKLGQ